MKPFIRLSVRAERIGAPQHAGRANSVQPFTVFAASRRQEARARYPGACDFPSTGGRQS